MIASAAAPQLLGVEWADPSWMLDHFGGAFFWLSLVVIVIECGLFFPFLPGDTLLFAVGLFIAGGRLDVFPGGEAVNIVLAMVAMGIAAWGGNVIGFEIGQRIGPRLYQREGRIIRREHFDSTEQFFDKHGNKALVLGRFVPFVRTYVTVVAGVSRMDRRRFFLWSAVGAVLWVLSITLIGFFLGAAFPSLGDNIDKALYLILAVTAIPVAFEWIKKRRARAAEQA